MTYVLVRQLDTYENGWQVNGYITPLDERLMVYTTLLPDGNITIHLIRAFDGVQWSHMMVGISHEDGIQLRFSQFQWEKAVKWLDTAIRMQFGNGLEFLTQAIVLGNQYVTAQEQINDKERSLIDQSVKVREQRNNPSAFVDFIESMEF